MNRYRLIYRGNRDAYYSFDTQTKKRESLTTKDAAVARQIVATKNEAVRHPEMNLQLAQIYLQHADTALSQRTWQQVMEQIVSMKTGPTGERWKYAIIDKAFDLIRNRKLFQTTAEHFLAVLKAGSVTTNVYLRRIHNFAVGMHWLPWPVLPKLHWPPVKFKEKRAITQDEHHAIINREQNPELRAYYEMLWHLGGAQSDIAGLTTADVDWQQRTISFRRRKTSVPVVISFGQEVATVLAGRPKTGLLFPWLATLHEKHRAKHFIKRLTSVGIKGVSLHSYRYAWAERAKVVGMPERYAQQALGHNSKAFARSYSRNAHFVVPSLEIYERQNTLSIATN